MKYLIHMAALLCLTYSCKKEEGFGGRATVKGKIIERVYDESFTVLQNEIPAVKEDIFLVMGGNDYFGEKLETGKNGEFEVNYLQPGNYSLYYYSEDSASGDTGGAHAKVTSFSISGSNSTVDLGRLTKFKTIKYNKGTVTIKGIIMERAYNESYTKLQYERPAADEDIYLIVGNGTSFTDRIRASSDGSFEIRNLQLGNYSMYVYSDDSISKDPEKKVVVSKKFTLTQNDTSVNLGKITKFKTLKYDDGTSIIKGVIMVKYYNSDFTVLHEVAPAQNEDVFLVYGNRPYNEDRIRTMYNGSFAFPHLIKDEFKVYVLSDTLTNKKVTRSKTVFINSDNKTITLDTIYISKN